MKKKTYLLMALTMVSMGMNAQNSGNSSLEKGIEEFTKSMTIGGTIRSKYEYQTEEGEGRFEVRTARINVAGNVTPQVSYKAEIDHRCSPFSSSAVLRQPFVHRQAGG